MPDRDRWQAKEPATAGKPSWGDQEEDNALPEGQTENEKDFDVDDEKVETPSEQVEDFKHLEAVTREAKSITIFGGEKTAADFYSF